MIHHGNIIIKFDQKGKIFLRYYIADLHFFHAAINDLEQRHFMDVEEMNEYMIAEWNAKVRTIDDVVILGDLSFGNAEQTNTLLERLNGRLYLIQGNHDRFLDSKGINCSRFKWIKPYAELSDNKRKVILCHYPIMCYNGQYRLDEKGNPKTYMLYGHVHDTQEQRLIEQFQDIIKNTIISDLSDNNDIIQHIPCNMINCFCRYSNYEPLTLDEWIICDKKRREQRTVRK